MYNKMFKHMYKCLNTCLNILYTRFIIWTKNSIKLLIFRWVWAKIRTNKVSKCIPWLSPTSRALLSPFYMILGHFDYVWREDYCFVIMIKTVILGLDFSVENRQIKNLIVFLVFPSPYLARSSPLELVLHDFQSIYHLHNIIKRCLLYTSPSPRD